MNVYIRGLDKAAVLATLFNATAPVGMGFLQAGNGPVVMTIEEARKLIGVGTSPDPGAPSRRDSIYFDYLYGRCLKLDLTSDDEFDPWGFDRDNGGPGTAQKLIDTLRETGQVDSSELRDRRQAKLIENREATMVGVGISSGSVSHSEFRFGMSDVAAPVLQHMDRETERFIQEG